MTYLTHLTVNTGDLHEFNEATISERITRPMSPLLPTGGNLGKVSPTFAAFRVEITREPGVAAFTLWRGKEPIVLNVVCWDASRADYGWTVLEKTYLQLSDHPLIALIGNALPDVPAKTPWLATVILPGIATLTRDDIGWLGDFEKCMAVTILRNPVA